MCDKLLNLLAGERGEVPAIGREWKRAHMHVTMQIREPKLLSAGRSLESFANLEDRSDHLTAADHLDEMLTMRTFHISLTAR